MTQTPIVILFAAKTSSSSISSAIATEKTLWRRNSNNRRLFANTRKSDEHGTQKTKVQARCEREMRSRKISRMPKRNRESKRRKMTETWATDLDLYLYWKEGGKTSQKTSTVARNSRVLTGRSWENKDRRE